MDIESKHSADNLEFLEELALKGRVLSHEDKILSSGMINHGGGTFFESLTF